MLSPLFDMPFSLTFRLSQSETGTAGADTFIAREGNDSYDGGAGHDTLSYGGYGATVEIYGNLGFSRSALGRDTFTNIETFTATNGDDRLVGSDELENRLFGRGGSDVIKAGIMTTQVGGGGGNDLIIGASSNDDDLSGDNGNDTIIGMDGDDWINGGLGDDFLYGGQGQDLIYGEEDNDRIRGNRGEDTLYGDNGDDVLFGGADNDSLSGGSGDDYLYGENGSDILSADSGIDSLTGGAGNDYFSFVSATTGTARIKDFTPGSDQLYFYDFGTMDFSNLQAAMTQRPSGLRIDVGDHIIFLANVAAGDLSESDVIFGGF